MATNANKIQNDARLVFLKEPHDTGYEYHGAYRTDAGLRTGLRFVKLRSHPTTRVLVVKVVAGKALRADVSEMRFQARQINSASGLVR
jgi:hypothetical protein